MTHALSPKVRVRFAPAPTGFLHLGGARTALFNWLFARHHGGAFILRIEDTDLERNLEEAAAQVIAGLRWLGLDWDEGPGVGGDCGPYFQSQRRQLHLDHSQALLDEGKAYECYMTPAELEAHRQVAIAAGRPFHYEGWHRNLSAGQLAAFRAEGRRPAIRLLVEPPPEGYLVDDLIRDRVHFPPDQIDDFVLVRSDGTPSFHLANVVDDWLMGITHVIRGEDHLTNTVRHQILFERLGWVPPRYAHLPMILGEDRSKLSKRHGAVSVLDYRDKGYLPDAMVNELALLGWSAADGREELSRAELVERFDLDRCGKSGAIFDFAKLDHLNRVRIAAMTPVELAEAVRPWVGSMDGMHAMDEMDRVDLGQEQLLGLVEVVRDELVRLADFPVLARRILNPPEWAPEVVADENVAQYGREIAKILVESFKRMETWDRAAIKAVIQATGKGLGIKGKSLFMPLRVALTGALHGPALDGVAFVLGREACLDRMNQFLQRMRAA